MVRESIKPDKRNEKTGEVTPNRFRHVTSNEVLKDFILKDLDRSATYIQSRGMYSNDEKEMIFLVVPNKDVPLVQSTIHELDPTAFIVVTDAYDTFGEGFKPLPSKDEIQNI